MGIKIYIGQRETGPIESKQQSVMMDAMPNLIEPIFYRIHGAEIFRNIKNPPTKGDCIRNPCSESDKSVARSTDLRQLDSSVRPALF